MNYDHFSEGSENDLKYPGTERVKYGYLGGGKSTQEVN